MQNGKVRKCKNCKTPIVIFNSLTNLCTSCLAEKMIAKRAAEKQRIVAKQKAQRKQKPMVQRKPLKQNGKQSQAWINYRRKWFREHPDEFFVCHYCKIVMPRNETTLDHKIPRSRRADLRYVDSNIVPACGPCNNEKGSMDDVEYMKFRRIKYANAT